MPAIPASSLVPETFAPGRTRTIAYTDRLMLVIFDFANGPFAEPDPPHSHPHEQVSYVVEGEIIFFLDGEPTRLGPGSMVSVPSNVPHSIQVLTSSARLIDSFTPIREEFLKK